MITRWRNSKKSPARKQSISKLLPDLEKTPNWRKDFPVVGQGTIVFNAVRSTPFSIVVRPKPGPGIPNDWISLEVLEDIAIFKVHINGVTTKICEVQGQSKLRHTVGYEAGRKVSYWFSYNRRNMELKYGKGYRMQETTIMTANIQKLINRTENNNYIRQKFRFLFSNEIRRVIEQYDIEDYTQLVQTYSEYLKQGMTFGIQGGLNLQMYASIQENGPDVINTNNNYNNNNNNNGNLEMYASIQDAIENSGNLEVNASMQETGPETMIENHVNLDEEAQCVAKCLLDMEKQVEFDKYPVTTNWPPKVADSRYNTLERMDSNRFTLSSNLPLACQQLYNNVVQEGVELDWPKNAKYKLSDAIRYSIKSKNGTLNKKLQAKSAQFGADPKKTYLRVTLGVDHATAPGIPYVLEIWPSGHGSPIHNHGNAYAVIKVLHGGLTINVYNKDVDSKNAKSLQTFDVTKNDVTWISPNWYQTHKLWNHTNDFCATIQCYNYGENDHLQWPYFDYVKDQSGEIGGFLPDSDFRFNELKEIVMKEYADYRRSDQQIQTPDFAETCKYS